MAGNDSLSLQPAAQAAPDVQRREGAARQALKYVWRNFGVRDFYLDRKLRRESRDWADLRAAIRPQPTENRFLVIPSDPYLLTASLGDQAMIGSILEYWRAALPGAEVCIATAHADADRAALELGGRPVRMMGRGLSLSDVRQQIGRERFRAAILMGADGLDGSYDPVFSGHQLMALDMAARQGAECFITGFSVSKTFHPGVRRVFAEIAPAIRINLRDPLSYDRFATQAQVPAHRVADVAFLLSGQVSPRVAQSLEWVAGQRAAGRRVVAINFHPLLLELQERGRFPALLAAFTQMLRDLAARLPVSFLLLSHDTRGASADAHGLEPIRRALKDELGERLHYPAEQLRAPEIKGLVHELDAVVSGRMHLMIASLGAGTPVFGIDYKDKMEGLLMLLGLETGNLATAADLLADPAAVGAKIEGFLAGLEAERPKIAARLPHIRAMALENFGGRPVTGSETGSRA